MGWSLGLVLELVMVRYGLDWDSSERWWKWWRSEATWLWNRWCTSGLRVGYWGLGVGHLAGSRTTTLP